jgi:hypothetical protein
MVKNIFIILIIVCCVSCRNKPQLIRMDSTIIYKNYLQSDSIPFDISKLFDDIRCDSFDARFIHKSIKMTKLTGNAFNYLFNEHFKCYAQFNKNFSGDEYVENNVTNYEELFSCGKFSIQKGIQSLIVLLRSPHIVGGGVYNSIIMYNTKNNRLCSIVELSSGTENKETSFVIKSYIENKCFVTTNDIGGADISAERGVRSLKSLFSALKSEENDDQKLAYSIFRIDTIGFIRFVKLDNSHMPKALNNK